MTRLILVRHGNTFNPNEKPVWVGARSDLPLTQAGLTQAETLGRFLAKAGINPASILAGPLQRTQQTAQIIADSFSTPLPVVIDSRLTEIDYGAWEGKTNEDIIAMGDQDRLEAWNKRSVFPVGRDWQPNEIAIAQQVDALLSEVTAKDSIIVTSNGILRFFARAAVNAPDFHDRKVATGNICVMQAAMVGWRIILWNAQP